jgi:hypothetical protein
MNEKPWIFGVLLLFATAFWICSLPIFILEPLTIPAVFSLIIVVVSACFWSREYEHTDSRKWSILLIPFVISSVIIPYPFNIGFMLLAVGFFLLAVLPQLPVWSGIAVSGLIFTIQGAGVAVYYLFIPSGHSAPLMSYLIYPVLKIFGFTASFDRGVLFIQKAGDVFPFPITWDALGIYPLILVFLPAFIFLLLKCETLEQLFRQAAGFLGLTLAYMLFRYGFLLHFYFVEELEREALSQFRAIFFSPLWMVLTCIPFVILIILIYHLTVQCEFGNFKMKRTDVTTCGVFLLSAFLLFGGFYFQEQGEQKQGRVLVDEIHSTWEPSYLIMDTQWYGTESTYNAYSMIEWLKVTYDVDRVVSTAFVAWEPGETITKVEPELVSDEITADILQSYDILILKTPTMYTQEEIAAIVNFVRNGGGLYVIGDHSNFAGTSTALNEIIRHFSLEFVFNSVNNVEGRLSTYERGEYAHPCAQYMPEYDFLTSCSIKAPLTVGRVIPGYGLSAEPGEYASTGFFRETRRDLPILATDRTWGIFHQCVAAKYGKGRIVAFSDSTTISNFRIFFGGTDGMVIGCMEWLNYSNEYPYVTTLLWIGGIGLAGVGIFLFSAIGEKRRIGILIMVVCAAGLGSSLSIAAFTSHVYDYIPADYYDWDNTVCFDQSHSSEIVDSGDREGVYSVFLIWTQRVGRVPSIERSLKACTEKGKTIVIVDPVTENFSSNDIEILKEHMKKGGNVLMMVDQARVLGLNVINEFGLKITEIEAPKDAEKGNPLEAWGPSIAGGEALKSIGERVIIARASYGEGWFVLCTISHVFRDGYGGEPGYMGFNGTNPYELSEEHQKSILEIYSLEYELFSEILN